MSENQQEQSEAKLLAYVEGELDPAERAEIEKHLAANPHHRRMLDELARTRDMMRWLPREQAPVEMFETFQSQLERSVLLEDAAPVGDTSSIRMHRWTQWRAIAAAVALAAGLGVIVWAALPGNNALRMVVMGHSPRPDSHSDGVVTESTPSAPPSAEEPLPKLDAMKAKSAPPVAEAAKEEAESLNKSDAAPATPSVADAAGALASSARRDGYHGKGGPAGQGMVSRAADVAQGDADRSFKRVMADNETFSQSQSGRAAQVELAMAETARTADQLPAVRDLVGNSANVQNQALSNSQQIAPQIRNAVQSPDGGWNNGSLYLVVASADPEAASRQITGYLVSNSIPWNNIDATVDQVPPANEVARGTATAEPAPKDAEATQSQSQAPTAAPSQAAVSQSETPAPAPPSELAPAPAPVPAAQRPAPSSVSRAQSSEARENAASPPVSGGAASQSGKPYDQKSQSTLSQAPSQGLGQNQQAMTQQRAGASPINNLFIARRMTRQQAMELRGNVNRTPGSQRAEVFEATPKSDGQSQQRGFAAQRTVEASPPANAAAAGASTQPAPIAAQAAIPSNTPATAPSMDSTRRVVGAGPLFARVTTRPAAVAAAKAAGANGQTPSQVATSQPGTPALHPTTSPALSLRASAQGPPSAATQPAGASVEPPPLPSVSQFGTPSTPVEATTPTTQPVEPPIDVVIVVQRAELSDLAESPIAAAAPNVAATTQPDAARNAPSAGDPAK